MDRGVLRRQQMCVVYKRLQQNQEFVYFSQLAAILTPVDAV